MANHIKMLSAESNVNSATAVTALNVLLAAQIAATAPQACTQMSGGLSAGVAVGPLVIFVAHSTVQYIG
jgi:hypothetical protein